MITLRDLLTVCDPDWIDTGKKIIFVRDAGIPEELLPLLVKDITGWDDGLTVEVCASANPVEEKLKQAIKRIYAYSAVGSALHIVLDDENVDDHNIQWCMENFHELDNVQERIACEECARLLLQLPVEERERIVHGYGRKWGL